MVVGRKVFALAVLWGALFFSCSSRQISLELETVRNRQLVTVETTSGQRVSGTVAGQSETALIIAHPNIENEFTVLDKDDIHHLRGPEPIIDDRGELVTEQEIDSAKHHINFTTHTFLGGLFSLGVSLFGSSLISNEFFDSENAFVVAGTALGSITGAVLFGQSGARKDRQMAIETLLTQRYLKSLNLPSSGTSDELIIEQIHALRRKRQQQEQEIERLKDEIRGMEQLETK